MLPSVRRVLSSSLVQALTTPHGVDRYLEVFNPIWAVNDVRAQVSTVRHQTPDSVTLSLRPNRNWRGFRAGQYVRLSVEINGVRRTRCYSPANSVHTEGLIELTAKTHADGFVSKFLHQHARPGMVVTLSQAEGTFALPEQRPDRILLISGGSGITPVMSMLRTLCDEGHTGRITFLHYALTSRDMIYSAEVDEIARRYPNVELLRAYTTQAEGGDVQGLFSRQQLEKAVPDYAAAQTFLCGPPGLMKAVQKLWTDEGIAEHLYLEHFSAAPVATMITDRPEGEVRFARSERLAANSGASLLDQAEAAGLKPEAGCRMGICHSCTCRKSSGRVRDLRNGQISDSGEEDIQICITVPVGTVTLEL